MIRAFVFLLALVMALPARAGVEIKELTTPGGINAWLVEEHSFPFVALELRFRGGAALDAPGKRGAVTLMTATLEEGKEDVCPVCQGSGYFGQEGVFEVYQIGADEKQPLANGDLSGFRNAIKRKRLPSIQEAAVNKALTGVTSVEEVARITGGSSSKSKKTGTTQKVSKPATAG